MLEKNIYECKSNFFYLKISGTKYKCFHVYDIYIPKNHVFWMITNYINNINGRGELCQNKTKRITYTGSDFNTLLSPMDGHLDKN